MYYAKSRSVKSPSKTNETDAGIDFYVPEFTKSFITDFVAKNPTIKISNNKIFLDPQQRILIPSGIYVNLAKTKQELGWKGIMLVAHNKSGKATTKGLDRLAEVVDEQYMGEVHISVVNTSNHTIFIEEHEKLIQFCLEEVSYKKPIEMSMDELYSGFESTRGDNGFGHSDKL